MICLSAYADIQPRRTRNCTYTALLGQINMKVQSKKKRLLGENFHLHQHLSTTKPSRSEGALVRQKWVSIVCCLAQDYLQLICKNEDQKNTKTVLYKAIIHIAVSSVFLCTEDRNCVCILCVCIIRSYFTTPLLSSPTFCG